MIYLDYISFLPQIKEYTMHVKKWTSFLKYTNFICATKYKHTLNYISFDSFTTTTEFKKKYIYGRHLKIKMKF